VGVVDGLNLGAYNDGDTVYLGATPGSFTATKPYAPNHLVYVGIIERANAGNGELYVRVQNGYELDEIHDVQITTPPASGSLLIRDNPLSLWKAATLTAGTNIAVTSGDAAVTVGLTGTVAVANGGTGVTTSTGTGSVVLSNTPTLTTPNIGAATGTSFNLTGSGTLGTTLTVSGTTDSSSKDTGAIVTEGGLGVEKSANIGGNVTVSGTGGSASTISTIGTGTNAEQNSLLVDATTSGTPAAGYGPSIRFTRKGNDGGSSSTSGAIKSVAIAGTSGNQYNADIIIAPRLGGSLIDALTVKTDGGATIAGNLTVSGGTITGGASGMSLASGGTNQNITLTPNGTGGVTLQGGSSNGDVLLKLRGTSANPNGTIRWTTSTDTYTVGIGSRFNVADNGLEFLIGSTTTGMNLRSNGRLLLGTGGVDSGALLQVGTNTTTSAGGMVFGTDLSLYRGNTGFLILNDSAASDARIGLFNGGTQRALFEAYGVASAVYMGAASAGWATYITSGNQAIALTLDSSQNANFAAFIYQKENQALRWTSTGASGGTIRADIYADNTGVLNLRTGSTPTSALTLGADQNSIFGGSIKTSAPSGGTAAAWKLGTVATVSPTSPNRTIEVDIGGTIYYIHAKTTNN